jgi:protein O-GlcNAc transferase
MKIFCSEQPATAILADWVVGASLHQLKRYEEAIECFDQTLKIDPNAVHAWYNKGEFFSNLGKYDKAIEWCDKVLEMDSKFSRVWYEKRNDLQYLERFYEAIECHNTLLKARESNEMLISTGG